MRTPADPHKKAKAFVNRCRNVTADQIDWNRASLPTKRYNCMGFAIGILGWFQPPDFDENGKPKNPTHRWMNGADPDPNGTLEGYIKVAELKEFSRCETSDPEPGLEKITLYYTTQGEKKYFTHAVLHLSGGRCASKCGPDSDFEHPLNAFDGCHWYGVGRVHMCRSENLRAIPRELVADVSSKKSG